MTAARSGESARATPEFPNTCHNVAACTARRGANGPGGAGTRPGDGSRGNRICRRGGAVVEADQDDGQVAGDEAHAADPGLRSDLEDSPLGYVLAVAKAIRSAPGRCPPSRSARRLPAQSRVAAVLRRCRAKGTATPTGPESARPQPARAPLAADPPQPAHRRAGLLPLLLTRPSPWRRCHQRRARTCTTSSMPGNYEDHDAVHPAAPIRPSQHLIYGS